MNNSYGQMWKHLISPFWASCFWTARVGNPIIELDLPVVTRTIVSKSESDLFTRTKVREGTRFVYGRQRRQRRRRRQRQRRRQTHTIIRPQIFLRSYRKGCGMIVNETAIHHRPRHQHNSENKAIWAVFAFQTYLHTTFLVSNSLLPLVKG